LKSFEKEWLMATSEEITFPDLVPHLKLLRVITLGDLVKLQDSRSQKPDISLDGLFSQLVDLVYEVIEEVSFCFEQEKLLTPFLKPIKPLFEQVSAFTYPYLNTFRAALIPIFREKMFKKGISQRAFLY